MRLTERVHHQLEQLIRSGDLAIDATAGNGHDTLALAQAVGPTGRVQVIDLQAAAIEATRKRLAAAGALTQCTLQQGDHSRILRELPAPFVGGTKAITFNLGYLPGGDRSIVSQATNTRAALDAAVALLGPGGCLFVTAYRGHPGGQEETRAVAQWMQAKAKEGWTVQQETPEQHNPDRLPPILWMVSHQPPSKTAISSTSGSAPT